MASVEFTPRQKVVLEAVKGPASAIFGAHGIKLRPGKDGKFLNLSKCPWCGHGTDTSPNYQCGVGETPSGAGSYIHSFKCFHNDKPGHYADVLAEMGVITPDEANWVRNLRSEIERQQLQVQLRNSASDLKAANKAFKERLARRLRDNPTAMTWLTKTRGFSPAVIEHFQLGLSEPYKPAGAKAAVHSDSLVAPLLARDGKFYGKYVNYAVPGVTTDNREKKLKAWSSGPARAYFSDKADGRKFIFICDGLKDVWALWDKLQGTELGKQIVFVSSTNGGGGMPEEWKVAGFWEPWEQVYLGHDSDEPDPKTGRRAGDEHAKAIAGVAMRETRRVWPIGFKDWNDFFLGGKTVQDFAKLLEASHVLSLVELKAAPDEPETGMQAAEPVSVVGNYLKGHLYEAIDVVDYTQDDDTGETLQRLRTLVVRSDRTLHATRAMPAPKGTPTSQLVFRLVPDGAHLTGPVKASPNCTWKWSSIQQFLKGQAKERPLRELIQRIERHLRASVWLPYDDDFALLACTVVATYMQSVFDAVPLLLVTGPAGSGKSQLGIAMSELCCNSPATPIGQISAASIARLVDETRGFVALDDLESVGKRAGADPQFDDLVQALKLSYNRHTSMKIWTNMKTGKLERLNFFGIKLINNTTGVDSILGTRMFVISTKFMPEGTSVTAEGRLAPEERTELRNELHTWAFCNVAKVAQAYGYILPNKTSRDKEIAAPLRVVAALADDAALHSSLEKNLERQARRETQPETTEQLLQAALEDIILESFDRQGIVRTVVTLTEAMMKMALMVDTNYGKDFTTDLPEYSKPEVVGRHFVQRFAKQGSSPVRVNLFGKYLRGRELDESFVTTTLTRRYPDGVIPEGLQRSSNGREFCQACADCAYRANCDIRKSRENKEPGAPDKPVRMPTNGRAAH